MKKLLVFLVAMLLSACGSVNYIADTHNTCGHIDCDITAVHHHMY
jgi:uncharacterized protein YceK